MGNNERVHVLGAGVADAVVATLLGFDDRLRDGCPAVLLGRPLDERGSNANEAFLVGLGEQAHIEHNFPGADDVAALVADLHRAEHLVRLHNRTSVVGLETNETGEELDEISVGWGWEANQRGGTAGGGNARHPPIRPRERDRRSTTTDGRRKKAAHVVDGWN